jgi:hypothetical protein
MRAVLSVIGILGSCASAAAFPTLPVAPPQMRPAVAVAADEADDAGFLFRLGLMEGHLIIGRELNQAGRPKLGLPHFGHPVRELYDDVSDYLAAKKVQPFDRQLIELEALAARGAGPAFDAKYDLVIAALHRAREAAPAAMRASVPAMIRICADTVEAAAGEYGEAIERGRIEALVEYHDSRGFLSYLDQELERLDANADGAGKSLIARFRTVLAKAHEIVAPLIPPDRPIKSVADYRAIASEAKQVAKP